MVETQLCKLRGTSDTFTDAFILYFIRVFAKVRFSKFTSSKIVPNAIFAVHFLKSGRLDVCKSGVCGAGLNRNME